MKKIIQFIIKNISAWALIALWIIAAITGVYAFQSMTTTPATTWFQSGPAPMLTKTSGTYNRDTMSLQAISESAATTLSKQALPCSPQPANSNGWYRIYNWTTRSDCQWFTCTAGKYYCGIDNTCRNYPSCSSPATYNLTFKPFHSESSYVNSSSMLSLRCTQWSYVSSVTSVRTMLGWNNYTGQYFQLELYWYDLWWNKTKYDTTNTTTVHNYYNNIGVKEINWTNTNKNIWGVWLVWWSATNPRFWANQIDIYWSTWFWLSNQAGYSVSNNGRQLISFNITITCMPM